MTDVTLFYGDGGRFTGLKASGHAGFAVRGNDIVCAAVTVLLRTAMQLLSESECVKLTADTGKRGELSFSLNREGATPETESRIACIRDFLKSGLESLVREYPQNVQLHESKEN